MSFLDDAKNLAEEGVDKIGADKVNEGLDKVGDIAKEKTGGKFDGAIDAGLDRAEQQTEQWDN